MVDMWRVVFVGLWGVAAVGGLAGVLDRAAVAQETPPVAGEAKAAAKAEPKADGTADGKADAKAEAKDTARPKRRGSGTPVRPVQGPDNRASQVGVCQSQCNLERMSCDSRGAGAFRDRADQLRAGQSSCYLAVQSCLARCR
jgi:hypothetical protein